MCDKQVRRHPGAYAEFLIGGGQLGDQYSQLVTPIILATFFGRHFLRRHSLKLLIGQYAVKSPVRLSHYKNLTKICSHSAIPPYTLLAPPF